MLEAEYRVVFDEVHVDRLFDGRLEQFGIRENIQTCRSLTSAKHRFIASVHQMKGPCAHPPERGRIAGQFLLV